MKSYGRAPTFLLATGHEQVRSIAAALAGDTEAAARVELELPETGVCNAQPSTRAPVKISAAASACCGSAAPIPAPDALSEVCCTPETPQGACCAPKPELAVGAACYGPAS